MARASLNYKTEDVLDGLAQEFGLNRATIREYLRGLEKKGYKVIRPKSKVGLGYSYTNNGESSEVTIETTERIRNERDLIRILEIDENEWVVDRFQVRKTEAYRKDRTVDWSVSGGIADGEVHDSGTFLIEPIFSVRVWLKRKTPEIRTKLVSDDLKEDLKKFAPKYNKIKYPKSKVGLLLEIEIPDIHVGKLAWGEETGQDSDLKLQTARVISTLKDILSHVNGYHIEKIVLPIGHDFFNSDNQKNETTAGTAMSEDTRWRKTYRSGRILAVTMIDMCSQVAPVDVVHVPGNHSEEREWHLCDALESWYHNNPNVHVDNSPKKRKYYQYGQVLIGMTHGNEEKLDKLPMLMPTEVPQMWASSKYREWHIGHLHHKKDMIFKTSEDSSIVVRILRSLSGPDDWHYNRGFVGALQSSEAFLWDKDRGLIAQIQGYPDA